MHSAIHVPPDRDGIFGRAEETQVQVSSGREQAWLNFKDPAILSPQAACLLEVWSLFCGKTPEWNRLDFVELCKHLQWGHVHTPF